MLLKLCKYAVYVHDLDVRERKREVRAGSIAYAE